MILGSAMNITEEEDAKQYLQAYIDYIQARMDADPDNPNFVGKTAEEIAKGNIGYYAGYYDHDVRIRVERLFQCSHPIFGQASLHEPTVEEAFKAGQELAR